MKPKQIYLAFLVVIIGIFAYSLYAGRLFYELNTQKQWDSTRSGSGSGVTRFYHK